MRPTRCSCGWSALVALLSPLLATVACFAGEDSWKERFLTDAPRKWEEYRSWSSRFQGSAELRDHGTYNGAKSEQSSAVEFKQNRGRECALLISEIRGSKRPWYELHGTNSQYHFHLTRGDRQRPWILVGWKPISNSEALSKSQAKNLVDDWTGYGLQFSRSQDRLPKLIKQTEFHVKSVTPTRSGGRELAKIEFAYQPKNVDAATPNVRHGWVVLDPERYWVIDTYETTFEWANGPKGLMAGIYEYVQASSGAPIPKRQAIKIKQVDEDGRKHDVERTLEFKISEGEVAEGEFFLSAFGLPEPVGIHAPNRTYLWILIGAGICATAALLFRYLVRGRTATTRMQ